MTKPRVKVASIGEICSPVGQHAREVFVPRVQSLLGFDALPRGVFFSSVLVADGVRSYVMRGHLTIGLEDNELYDIYGFEKTRDETGKPLERARQTVAVGCETGRLAVGVSRAGDHSGIYFPAPDEPSPTITFLYEHGTGKRATAERYDTALPPACLSERDFTIATVSLAFICKELQIRCPALTRA